MISLYVNHYNAGDEKRQAEIDECLRKNLDNPLIDRVVILVQSTPEKRKDLQSAKAIWREIDCSGKPEQRPSFRDFFDCINQFTTSADEIQIVAHSDVYFDDSLSLIRELNLELICLALTRWEMNKKGEFHPHLWDTSQDAWIFQGYIRPLGDTDFPIGAPGAEGRLTWELRHADYKVVNPSLDVQARHLHASGIRTMAATIGPPHEDVWRGTLKATGIPTGKQFKTGLIAMSLFGQKKKYLAGAIENARLVRHIYPGWTLRFYVDSSVPEAVIQQLRQLKADVRMMSDAEGMYGLFWRFLAADDPGFARWMVRDADSRLSYRERRAVDEWIDSGLPFHTMRDHPGHRRPIMGCAFGGVRGALVNMEKIIAAWPTKGKYADDESMLAEVIYPLVKESMLVHDSFARQYTDKVRPFPIARENFRFIGERFDENEEHNHNNRNALIAQSAARRDDYMGEVIGQKEEERKRQDTRNENQQTGDKNREPGSIITKQPMTMTNNPKIQQQFKLALQHQQADRLTDAEMIYQQILASHPQHDGAMHQLGLLAVRTGRFENALELFIKAVALNPRMALYHSNLGNVLATLGRHGEAIDSYREAIKCNPNYAMAYNNLGNLLERQGRLDEAIEALRTAIRLKSDYAEPYGNLGNVLEVQGQTTAAMEIYRTALKIHPHFPAIHSNLLYGMHYLAEHDPAAVQEENRRWNQQYVEPLKELIQPHENDRTPSRRLKIGYLSPDIREHSVAYFLESLLAAHDPDMVEIFCYAELANPDHVSRRIELNCIAPGHWRRITGQSDRQVADMIRGDQIDILVDLAGHTARNRLTIFALKPAPIQVTYLGYPDSTGLNTIAPSNSDTFSGAIYGPGDLAVGSGSGSLTFSGATLSSNLTISPNATLTIDGTLTIDSGDVLTVNAGGTLTFAGSYSNSELAGSGQIALEPGNGTYPAANMTLNESSVVVSGPTINDAGTITLSNSSYLYINGAHGGALNIQSGGCLNINADSHVSITTVYTTTGSYWANAGTIDINGSLAELSITANGQLQINNTGTINVNSGSFQIGEGTYNITGSYNGDNSYSSNASLNMSVSFNNNGTIVVSNGGYIGVAGTAVNFNDSNGQPNSGPNGGLSSGSFTNSGNINVSVNFTNDDNMTLTSTSSINIRGGSVSINGGSSYSSFNNATGATINTTGSFTNATGGYITGGNSSIYVNGGMFGNNGITSFTDNGTLEGAGDFTNAGTIDVSGSSVSMVIEASSISYNNSAGPQISNTGTITASGGSVLTAEIQGNKAGGIVNSSTGVIDADGGTITLNANNVSSSYISNSGLMITSNGGTINEYGATTGNEIVNLNGGTLTQSLTLLQGWTVDIAGGLTINSGVTLTVDSGATLDITGNITLNGGTLTNAGTVDVSGGGNFYLSNNAVINNEVDGLFDIENSGSFNAQDSSALVFNNYGTLEKTGDSGTSAFGMMLFNTGQVIVDSGILQFSGGGYNSGAGTFIAENDGVVNFHYGTFAFSGSSSDLTTVGNGQIRVSGGYINTSATLDVGNMDFTGGTITGTGSVVLTDGSQGTWSGGTLGTAMKVEAGATLDITGGVMFSDGTLTNDGTLNVPNSGSSSGNPGSQIITNPMTYQVLHDQTYTTPLQLSVLRDDWATDGGTLTAILISQPNSGTVTVQSDGQFTYTPALHFTGETSFTYEAQEGSIVSSPVTVTLNVTDSAPVVQNASYTMLAGQTLQISAGQGVLSVDYDPDGDPLTVQLLDGPNDGTLSLNTDGSFNYTPKAGFTGSDGFTYSASDGVESATASVTINVADSGPVGVNQNFQVLHGQTLSGNMLTGAYDPNGATLTATLENGDGPSDGTLDLNSNGMFTYTPDPGFAGSDGFTFQVSDGTVTNTYTASISVENFLPLVNPQAYSVAADSSSGVTGDVLAGISAPDGSQLTAELYADGSIQSSGSYTTADGGTVNLSSSGYFTYTPGTGFVGADAFYFVVSDGAGQTSPTAVTINVTDPQPQAVNEFFSTSGGTTASGNLLTQNNAQNSSDNLYVILPNDSGTETTADGGIVTLNQSGGFNYSAAAGFTGLDSFTYAISDGILTSSSATVTIDVNKMPPQVVSGFFSGPLNQNITGNVLAGDTDPSGASLAVASVNGESLSSSSQNISIAGGSLSISSNGSFTFTPSENFSGQTNFSYVATDGDLSSASATVTLSIQNVAVAAVSQTYTTDQGQPVSGNLLTNAAVIGGGSATLVSINGDSISSSGYIDAAGGYVSAGSNGSFTYTPSLTSLGQYQFSYTLSDAGQQSTGTVTINVAVQPPTAGAASFQGQENEPLDIPFSSLISAASDSDSAATISFNGIVVNPQEGSVSVDTADQELIYTPNHDFYGNDGFDYTVVDSFGNISAPATVTLNIAQSATPALTANSINVVTQVNQSASVNAAPPGSPSGIVVTVGQASYGTVSVNGDIITYTPNYNSNHADSFGYTLTDTAGQTASGEISVTVLPLVPALNPIPTMQVTTTENQSTSIPIPEDTNVLGQYASVNFVDVTGESADGGYAYVDGSSIEYIPPHNYTGNDSFAYTIYNANWQPTSPSTTVNITILPPDPAPTPPPQPQPVAYTSPPETNPPANPANQGPVFTLSSNTGGDLVMQVYSYIVGNDDYSFTMGFEGPSGSGDYMYMSIDLATMTVTGSGAYSYAVSVGDTTINGSTPNFILSTNFSFVTPSSTSGLSNSLQVTSAGSISSMSYSGNISVYASTQYGSIENISSGGNISASSGYNIGNLTSTGMAGYITANAAVNLGNVTADSGHVNIYAGGNIGNVVAGSANSAYYNQIYAGENIQSVTSYGNIYKITSKYGNIGAVSAQGNINSVSAGRYLTDASYAGDITGAISAGGYINYISAENNIDDSITAGGYIKSISAGDNIDESITAGGYIGSVSTEGGNIEGTITANSYIDSVSAGGDILDPISAQGGYIGTITAESIINGDSITAEGYIFSITTDGNMDAGITASGNIGNIDAIGGNISGSITAGGYIGARFSDGQLDGITAHDDVAADISASGDITYVDAGKSLSGSVNSTSGYIGWLQAGENSSATISADDISGVIIGKVLSGRILSSGNIGDIYVGSYASGSSGINGAHIVADGNIANISVGNGESDSGGIVGANIIAGGYNGGAGETGNIGSITVYSIAGYGGYSGISGSIQAQGNINSISSYNGSISASINAGGNIGSITTNNYGDVNVSADISSGMISAGNDIGNISAGGSIIAPITAGAGIPSAWIQQNIGNGSYGYINSIYAQLNVDSISAVGYIGSVTAENGDIYSIDSKDSSIYAVSAGGNIAGNITAEINIGYGLSGVTAGGYISGNIQATMGNITFVEAGTNPAMGGNITGNIQAGENIGFIIAYTNFNVNDGSDPSAGPDPTPPQTLSNQTQISSNGLPVTPTLAMLPAPPNSTMGAIGGSGTSIQAGGSIGTITAEGSINASISSGTYLGSIWALGNVAGTITAGQENVNINAWGNLSANVTAASGSISAAAYGNLSGNLTANGSYANSGYVNASSWNALSGTITAAGGVSAWAAGTLSSNITAGGSVSEISWANISNSVTVGSSNSSGSGSGSNSGGSLIAEALNDLNSTTSGQILSAVMDAWGTLDLSSSLTLDGYFIGFSQGSLNVSGSINAPNGVTLVSAGSISGGGSITTNGNVGIAALGSVNISSVTATPATNGASTDIDVSGSTISGVYNGTNVYLDTSGSDTAVINGTDAEIRAGGSVTGGITVSGTADVVAEGNVSAPITADRGAAVTTEGSLQSNVSSSQGGVVIQSQGDIDGSITAYTYANVVTWGQLLGSVTTGAGGGYISVFAAQGVSGAIDAGGDASVQSLGNVSSTVTAGDGSSSGTEFTASISADGNISGSVTSSGSVAISATQGVSSSITATAGYASIQAGGTFNGTVTAQADVNILAASINGAGNITSQQGGVNIQSLADITGATISAASYATLFAGTTIDGNVTLSGSNGSVSSTSLGNTTSLNVAAPGATVNVISGGSATVNVGSDGSYAGTVTISANGSLSGSAYASGQISLLAAGSSGSLNFTATSTYGAIQAFSDGAMNADFTAESVTAVSMSTLTGTFTANGGAGYVGLSAAYAVSSVTVTAQQTVSIGSGGDITGGNVASGGGATISAAYAVTGLTLTTTNISSIIALDGGISGTLNIDTSGNNATPNEILASGAVSATITNGGSVSLLTPDAFTGSVNSEQSAQVELGGALDGSITAGGYAGVTAASIAAAITGQSVNVFSAGAVSSPITASGGTATVNADGAINAAISGQYGAMVYSAQNISGNVTSAQGSVNADSGAAISGDIQADVNANVSALGNISGSINASSGYANVATFGELSGMVNAAGAVNVSASGDISAPIQSSAGSVTVNTLGNLDGAVSAADAVNITALNNVEGNVTAGQDAIVGSLNGNVTGNVTASSGYANVSSPDEISSTITASGSATVSSGASSNLTINAASVTLYAAGPTQAQIDAGAGGVAVDAMGGALDAQIDSQGAVSINSTNEVDATLNATNGITISAAGMITGSAVSSSISISGGSNVAMNIQTQGNYANVIVDAIGDLSGNISAGGYATIAVGGSASGVSVLATGNVNLSTGGYLVGSLDSTDESIQALAGGGAVIGNSSAEQTFTLAAMGNLIITGATGITAGQNANISVGGYISGIISAGDSAYVTSVGDVYAAINAGQNITVGSLALIAAQMNAGDYLAVYSYGGIASATTGTANDITELWSTGNIAGSFTAQDIGSVLSFSNISASLTANAGSNGGGTIGSIAAWGNITGPITATGNGSVTSITALGYITGPINVTAQVQFTKGITAQYPTTPTNVLAGAQAALNGLNTAISETQAQIAQSQSAASAAIAAQQALLSQAVSQIQASNELSQAAAQEAVSSQTYAVTQAVTQALAYVQAQFTQAQQQSSTGLVSAQAAEQQLDASFADSLAQSQLSLNTMKANLTNALTQEQAAATQQESIEQQAASAQESQLQTDNQNRPQEWADLASSLFTNVARSIAADAANTAANILNAALIAASFAQPELIIGREAVTEGIYTLESDYLSSEITGVTNLVPEGEDFSASTALEGGESGVVDSTDADLSGGATADDEAADAVIEEGQGDAAEEVESECAGPGCFLAGTTVITGINSDGSYQTEQIQDVQVGQNVLSVNENDPNGPLQEEQVTAVQVHTVYSIREVNVQLADGQTETIDTTDSHPFYVEGEGWVAAEDLQYGNQLESPDGQVETVLGTSTEAEPNGVQVYNFTVANDHTYFVEPAATDSGLTTGLDAVLVHNSCFRQILIDAFGEPAVDFEAHHIIPSFANDSAGLADDLRALLNNLNINIDNSANGAFLNDAIHDDLHANIDDYIEAVYNRIFENDDVNFNDANSVLGELWNIGRELEQGTFDF